MSWFDVSKDGLGKILEARGKSFAVFELIQNSWDADGATQVHVILEPVPGKPQALLAVEDNAPDGFRDLSHAYTLFAESEKKGNPEKRGRFNVGEKLVLACASKATVSSTRGTIEFGEDGERHSFPRRKRESGSVVTATLRMTRDEFNEVCSDLGTLIVPEGIEMTFNGKVLEHRKALDLVVVTLPTEVADDLGFLRPTTRQTGVEFHEVLPGETASLYELGIPVVETGDRWHVNVGQKIPLTIDRTNVPPSYLRRIRAVALNALAPQLTPEQAAASWVIQGIESKDIEPGAVREILDKTYGIKRAIYDPSDPEANGIAASRGYKIIHGGAFSSDAWANIKATGAARPAGQITPSPKPFHADGRELETVPHDRWSPGMTRIAAYCSQVGGILIGRFVTVVIANDRGWHFAACYGSGVLTLNKSRLGNAWFEAGIHEGVSRLLIHELAHETESNHLAERFHETCCKLGAGLAHLALKRPDLWT